MSPVVLGDFVLFEDRLAPPGATAARLLTGLQGSFAGHDLSQLEAWAATAAAKGHWLALALDYELGYQLEPKAAPHGAPVAGPSVIRAWAFSACQALHATQVETWLQGAVAVLPPDERLAGVGGLSPAISQAQYAAAVARLLDYIRAGDCYQVNYTFPLDFTWFGSPLALYGALRQQQPVGFGALYSLPGYRALSLSPELFVEKSGDRLRVRPMKGTAARGGGLEADQRAASELQASAKNRAENLMIVDLLRNDLGRLAQPGSVQGSALFEVETYPTVHQMVSQVEAQAPDCTLADVLGALFPCGSITGAPKVRAMQIIGELEPQPRGLYTGSLGWVAPGGDLRLNVAIRTLSLADKGIGRLGVGSGIVADSEAGSEWDECLLKSAFLRRHDPGLELIETLRLEVAEGQGHYPLLALHQQRLTRSAAWLGYPVDQARWHQVLQTAAQQADGLWRVRLGLRHDGALSIDVQPLSPEPPGPRRLKLSPATIDADHPLRRHKTSCRALYNQALQAVSACPEVFDVLFLNQRGEVAEGARSNVFALIQGRWLTPPVTSGCLPGVWRQSLLDHGLVSEQVLTLADLQQAQALRCGNALRGWVEVGLDLSTLPAV